LPAPADRSGPLLIDMGRSCFQVAGQAPEEVDIRLTLVRGAATQCQHSGHSSACRPFLKSTSCSTTGNANALVGPSCHHDLARPDEHHANFQRCAVQVVQTNLVGRLQLWPLHLTTPQVAPSYFDAPGAKHSVK
jgi:hypothetical protein